MTETPNPHVASTPQFLELCHLADRADFNRRVATELIESDMQQDGTHLCHRAILVEDGVLRTSWFVRLQDTAQTRARPGARVKDGIVFVELELDCVPALFLALSRLSDVLPSESA